MGTRTSAGARVAAMAASAHWLARPHLVTAFLLVIWTILLEDVIAGRRAARWLLALPPMAALWANLHGGFLVALVVLAIYGAGLLIAARPWSDRDGGRHAGRDDAVARARRLLPVYAFAATAARPAEATNFLDLADDLLAEPPEIRAGRIAPRPLPGLGIEVDEDRLDHYRL